jgi:hypothetical protein
MAGSRPRPPPIPRSHNRIVSRKERMMKASFFVLLLCGLTCAAWAQGKPQSIRKTLPAPTAIQGIPCAKGYAWFFPGGQLQKCTVARDIPFGEIAIPSGSWITLTEDGKPRLAQMSHDAPVLGLRCRGGSLLGPSEGAVVALYPSGKLQQCYLAGDQTVQGVPCMSGGFFSDGRGGGVLFYESGKLQSCRLTRGFNGHRKGDRFRQTQ